MSCQGGGIKSLCEGDMANWIIIRIFPKSGFLLRSEHKKAIRRSGGLESADSASSPRGKIIILLFMGPFSVKHAVLWRLRSIVVPIIRLEMTQKASRGNLFILRLPVTAFFKAVASKVIAKYFLTRARAWLSPRRRERVVFIPGRVTWESEALNEITLIFSRLAGNKQTLEGDASIRQTNKIPWAAHGDETRYVNASIESGEKLSGSGRSRRRELFFSFRLSRILWGFSRIWSWISRPGKECAEKVFEFFSRDDNSHLVAQWRQAEHNE